MEEHNRSSASVIMLPEVEQWRPALPPDITTSERSILVRHYRDLGSETREKISSPLSQFYSVGIGLRPTQFSAHVNGKMIPDQRPHQGALYINEPSCALRTVFYKPAESVVLLVPVSLLIELGEECEEYHCPPDLLLRTIIAGQDRILHTLTEALIQEDTIRHSGGQLYLDTLGTAIVFYLLNHYSTIATASPTPSGSGPANKRIQRAQEYIDAHLKHPISLIDLSRVAGLSRMYFAAEFRRATGLRPHEYLLRQRVARAKQLLATSDLSLTAIAPMVGFENAGHLCTVFKRFVGESPVRWRHLH